MRTLTELSSKLHRDLKIDENEVDAYLSRQHTLAIEASEIVHAATYYPVFITRNNQNGGWAFSAITSVLPEQNVYMQGENTLASFSPSSIKTFPLYLMQKPDNEKQFTIGFDETSHAISQRGQQALFAEDGSATQALMERTQLLNQSLQLVKQSFDFSQLLDELSLIKAINLNVSFQSGETNKINGLHTIDEDAFALLSGEQLSHLQKQGYLMPIHALLMSLLQLNQLIQRHNDYTNQQLKTETSPGIITNVKIEVNKDTAQFL